MAEFIIELIDCIILDTSSSQLEDYLIDLINTKEKFIGLYGKNDIIVEMQNNIINSVKENINKLQELRIKYGCNK